MANDNLEELILLYFELGLQYKDILSVLAHRHRYVITERTLKRKLCCLGLSRRKTWTNLLDVVRFISKEIQTCGQLHGYRWMHTKCIYNGYTVRKEDVRIIMCLLDPKGCQFRQAGRLQRRAYFSKGPNFIWHLDGYDKLKPYGFCISGCIDGFSRKLIWLCVYNNNNNPRIIGGYYVKAIENHRGCPSILRGDLGTENSHVKQFQRFLVRNRHTDELATRSYIEGTSVHNQRIERWWGVLRKECVDFWMKLFQGLRDEGRFDGDFIDKSILQFCFMSLIQNDLDETMRVWNMHRIRPCRNNNVPSGRPDIMHEIPELYYTRDYLITVPKQELNWCKEECYFRGMCPVDEDIFTICVSIMEEDNLSLPCEPFAGINLYIRLQSTVKQLLN